MLSISKSTFILGISRLCLTLQNETGISEMFHWMCILYIILLHFIQKTHEIRSAIKLRGKMHQNHSSSSSHHVKMAKKITIKFVIFLRNEFPKKPSLCIACKNEKFFSSWIFCEDGHQTTVQVLTHGLLSPCHLALVKGPTQWSNDLI